jgi:O-antigen/teichoic acid export membrane protein
LLSLILWPILIPSYGIVGAAAGALAAQALPTLYYMHATHRRLLGLPWERFLREAAAPLVLPTAALLFVAYLGRGAAWTWPGFIAVNAAAGGLYLLLLWRALPDEDLRSAARWLGKA